MEIDTKTKMKILESERQLINDAIQSIGIDPLATKQKETDAWKLHRGSVQIIIIAQKTKQENGDQKSIICMMAPIVNISDEFTQKEALFEYILQTNHKLDCEAFSLSNNWLIMSSSYFLEDMRLQEVVRMLESMSFQSQKFVKILADTFEF